MTGEEVPTGREETSDTEGIGGWITLGAAWVRLLPLPPVSSKAAELLAEICVDGTSDYAENWTQEDTANLATEITLSEAGLSGELTFRGIGQDGRRRNIPAAYFSDRAVPFYTTHRGIDPDDDRISFVPLHDLHDEAWDAALTQATHHPELWTDWSDVWVETRRLEAFLAEFAPTPGGTKTIGLAWITS